MKRLIVLLFFVATTNSAHALWGVGDISFDPTTYGAVIKQYEEMVKLYENAKSQLDKVVSMEKTIREAQEAYDTLSKFDLEQAAKGLMPGKNSTSSFAALRGQIANTEGKISQNSSFVKGNLVRIGQLENLEILKRASATNLSEASGKPNAATSAKITAQSTTTLAALAAMEEQRRTNEDIAHSESAKLETDNLINSKKVYEAMGK
jgi:hypothetical protein